jgi:hypothetical protein
MPQSTVKSAQLFDRLLALSEEAGAANLFEVAYHALMAALHAAERDANTERVRRVCRTAAIQERAIEAMRPAHPLSQAAASTRGTESVYRTLQTHAQAIRLRIEGFQQLQRHPFPETRD